MERVLADALSADTRHVAETERRDQLHVHEIERRDELHLTETENRDELHLQELEARGALHAHEVQNLRDALASRDLLGQAKGVLMASLGCTADGAFQLIVKQSQHENRKAIDIAREIVERVTTRPDPPVLPG